MSPYTLFVDMWMNGVSGQNCRAASSRLSVPTRIDFEIEKGDVGGAVVRRLRGGMHDQRGPKIIHQRQDAGAIADIEIAMIVGRKSRSRSRVQRVSPSGRRKWRAGCYRRR